MKLKLLVCALLVAAFAPSSARADAHFVCVGDPFLVVACVTAEPGNDYNTRYVSVAASSVGLFSFTSFVRRDEDAKLDSIKTYACAFLDTSPGFEYECVEMNEDQGRRNFAVRGSRANCFIDAASKDPVTCSM